MPYHIAAALKRLSQPNYLAQTENILMKLKDHPLAQDPIPSPFPDLARLNTVHALYKGFYHAALNGDTVMRAQRNQARAESTEEFVKMYTFLHAKVGGDTSRLLDTGYPIPDPAPKTKPSDASSMTPTGIKLWHGPLSGLLLLKCKRAPRAGYDVSICTGDPSLEENWQHPVSHVRASRMEIPGCQPGQKYHVRVRHVTAMGKGPWSAPVSLISL